MQLDAAEILRTGIITLLVIIVVRLIEYILWRPSAQAHIEVKRLRVLAETTEQLLTQLLATNQHLIQRERTREELIAQLLQQLRAITPTTSDGDPKL